MTQSRNRLRLLAVCASACFVAGQALAWGAAGHRLIGRAAMAALPTSVPAFLRDSAAVAAVGELAREPDRWRGAGKTHDADRDPAHFLDLDDNGAILGGPPLAALPETRAAYDSALRAVGSDSWKAGYLPYSIIDSWQQLAKDLAYWRADAAAAAKTTDTSHRAWFLTDLAERQELALRDVGVLAHYVGDGSQPLHVTVHFNGWRPGPNPRGYTLRRFMAPSRASWSIALSRKRRSTPPWRRRPRSAPTSHAGRRTIWPRLAARSSPFTNCNSPVASPRAIPGAGPSPPRASGRGRRRFVT